MVVAVCEDHASVKGAVRAGLPSAQECHPRRIALCTGALSAQDRFQRRRLCFAPKEQRGSPMDGPASQSALMNVGSAHI